VETKGDELPYFDLNKKPKEYILMPIKEFNSIPISFLTHYYRDGWSVTLNKEYNVAVFYR